LKIRKIGETKYIPSVNRTQDPRPHPQDQNNLLGVKPVTHHPPFLGLDSLTGHAHPINFRPGLHFQVPDDSQAFFEVPKAHVSTNKPENQTKATQVLDDLRKQTNLTQVNDILNLLKNLLQQTSPKSTNVTETAITTSTPGPEKISPTSNVRFGYDPVVTTYNPRFSVPSSSVTIKVIKTVLCCSALQ
jgi:hypothetical protein